MPMPLPILSVIVPFTSFLLHFVLSYKIKKDTRRKGWTMSLSVSLALSLSLSLYLSPGIETRIKTCLSGEQLLRFLLLPPPPYSSRYIPLFMSFLSLSVTYAPSAQFIKAFSSPAPSILLVFIDQPWTGLNVLISQW